MGIPLSIDVAKYLGCTPMSGSIFALLAALNFAFNAIFLRRAVTYISDAGAGVLVTVPLGVPFMLLVLIIRGNISSIAGFSLQSYLWLSAAGILHYMVGRSLSYNCTQLVGANIASILRRSSTIVAVLLGVSVLGEPLGWQLIIGVLLIIIGLTLPGFYSQMSQGSQDQIFTIPRNAYLFGLGAGVSWGITPIMIKIGLGPSGHPAAGAFVSFSAATIALGLSLIRRERRDILFGMKSRTVYLFTAAGTLSCIANLMRFIALSMAPASVVHPLVSISPIFLLVLSFLFNRKLEILAMSPYS